MGYQIHKDHVTLDKMGKPKKITGSRFASILDLNTWTTPFETWCDMTKLYKEPFIDSIYTIAGKVIEPKIIKYLNDEMYQGRVVGPEDYFGNDFTKMRYDFYPHEPVFGGMWDALIVGKNGQPKAVIEIKTTKRAEDWQHGVPLNYKLQAMLYTKLLGLKQYIFAVAFLDDDIYEDPSKFVASQATVKEFVYELDDAEITRYMDQSIDWYYDYIDKLKSPEFDEKKDATILKELRTNRIESTGTIEDYIAIIDEIKPLIDENELKMKEYVNQLKKAEDAIKAELETKFTDQDNTVSIDTKFYEFRVIRSVKQELIFDYTQFKLDHPDLYNEYLHPQDKITVRKQIKPLAN